MRLDRALEKMSVGFKVCREGWAGDKNKPMYVRMAISKKEQRRAIFDDDNKEYGLTLEDAEGVDWRVYESDCGVRENAH